MKQAIQPTKYINRLVINGLWNRFDVDWNLNPDVNILVGENGMGKTTILNLIVEQWHQRHENIQKAQEVIIHTTPPTSVTDFIPSKDIEVRFLQTFDAPLQGTMDEKQYLKSYLDKQLDKTMSEYVEYQLKKSNQIIFKKIPTEKAFAQKLFLIETLNRLFQPTHKTVDTDETKLAFKLEDGQKIAWQDLSSGEKQLLIILLTLLCQDEKPAILLIDEPELSLHLRWQYALIEISKKLNPNCQLIVATHSPSIYGKGWRDKVTFIENILKPTTRTGWLYEQEPTFF
jgi:ABC-type cobalamin/Fe3+-siderophores transport system ATPase subunit